MNIFFGRDLEYHFHKKLKHIFYKTDGSVDFI